MKLTEQDTEKLVHAAWAAYYLCESLMAKTKDPPSNQLIVEVRDALEEALKGKV